MLKNRLYLTVKVNRKILVAALVAAATLFAAVFTVYAQTGEDAVEVPIVMYHSVLKDEARHGQYVISPSQFEEDLIFLEEHGYTTVLMSDLINYTEGGELPEKPIVLTFDDGYYNNYLYAFEIAGRHNARFVISPIGYYAQLFSESGEHNAYYSHATWQQLKEMVDSGLVEVQNHSYNLHKNENGTLGVKAVSGESDEQYRTRISEDILQAQEAIEHNVGVRPTTMVYPFGAMSGNTLEIMRSLGFKATLTCEERKNKITRDAQSLYDLGRYLRPSGVSSENFFTQKMEL